MKLSTKSLASALVAAVVNAAPRRNRLRPQRVEERYERVLQKHDRKGELRSSVLGLDPIEFRERERKHSLTEIVKSCGFQDERSYYAALLGKIRAELRQRGWTQHRIRTYEVARLQRSA